MNIDVLPDVALLEIFDFYVSQGQKVELDESSMYAWCTLVHVCRKWRDLVFGSPRRLRLQLWYKSRFPLKKMLDIWPSLPIAISVNRQSYNDNIVVALKSEHIDRIRRIELCNFPSWQLEEVLAAMHQPFPALSCLELGLQDYEDAEDATVPVIPDTFLGGSAPHLRSLVLDYIPFPGLPNLLLSATHLVEICLWKIPHSVYFPPEVLVDSLSALTRLEKLKFDFESPETRVDQISPHPRRPPPPTRTLVPVLTELWYRGLGKYLEDLVARIDAPLLDRLEVLFLREPILDNSRLTKFISRTPKFKARDEARLVIFNRVVSVALQLPQTPNRSLKLGISYRHSDLQLLPLAQVCSSSFPEGLIPAVEHLNIIWDGNFGPQDSDVIENSQWLALLRPFTGVTSLYISMEAVPRIALALQELVGERVTEVLPALETLSLYKTTSGPVQEGIAEFVSARQVAGHPITISYCEGYTGIYW